MNESILKQRVNRFWTILNETLVEKWLNSFNNRKLFGDEEPDLAILEKVKQYYYSDVFSKKSFLEECEEYNKHSDFNRDNGLPVEIVEINELTSYLPKIREILKTLIENKIEKSIADNLNKILTIFMNEYAGEMIDFSSDYTREYFYQAINNPEDNSFRKEAIDYLEDSDDLNDYLLCLPETYDLILKRNFNPKYLKYGLFLAYLDEFYLRGKTTRKSRYIFTLEDIKYWFSLIPELYKNNVKEYFFAFPFIPPRRNWVHPRKNIFLNKEKIEEIIDLKSFQHPEFRYNLNGSSVLQGLFPEIVNADIDIRIDYRNKNTPMTDEDFDRAVRIYTDHHRINVERVELKNGNYKYQGDNYDIYRASFGFISNYHVPAIRVNFDDEGYLFYPSAIIALLTGICVDIRYVTTKNQNPMNVIKKYKNKGFSFMLNEIEMALYIANESVKVINESYIPLVLNDTEYQEYIKNNLGIEGINLDDVPERFKLTAFRHINYLWHNELMRIKKRLVQTRDNLASPFT